MSKHKFSLSEAVAILSEVDDEYATSNYYQYGTDDVDNNTLESNIDISEDTNIDNDINQNYCESLLENMYMNPQSGAIQLNDSEYSGEMVELEIHVVDENFHNGSFLEELESIPQAQQLETSPNEVNGKLQTDQNNNITPNQPNAYQINEYSNMINQGGKPEEKDVADSVVENNTEMQINDSLAEQQQKRGRRKIRDKCSWKKEIRKRRRQAGEEYTDSLGKLVHKKELKFTKDCNGKCRCKCAVHFSKSDVERIHKHFWNQSDNEKNTFYAATTEKCTKVETKTKVENSRRKFTYKYYFMKSDSTSSEKIRVCKEFYFSTLQISDKRIEYFYRKIEKNNGKCFDDMRGKTTKRKTPQEDIDYVKDHINSFQKVPSHYCRASSTKQYLEKGLSLTKMFEMYQEKCRQSNRKCLKYSMYTNIFNKEFNLAFHVPKKDRCDLCEEEKRMFESDSVTEVLKAKYEHHQEDKILSKLERDKDRAMSNDSCAVVCFDLEKVFLLPRANVSNFFYKRKLSTYNLTAHCSIDKNIYNAVWTEAMAGRGGNEIASALTTLLHQILQKHPNINCFNLWSDSCVPQNKNSIMCFALKRFMIDHKNIKEIVQKFCCPGHSVIQEVDNDHSHIEKTLKIAEVFSPVSLVRVLKTIRPNFFKIVQMHSYNFHDFQKTIGGLKFDNIPFTKVKSLRYVSNAPFKVEYKTSFAQHTYTEAEISKRVTRKGPCLSLPKPTQNVKTPVVSQEKKRDLTSMLKFMSETDKQYYRAMKLVVAEKNTSSSLQSPKKRMRFMKN